VAVRPSYVSQHNAREVLAFKTGEAFLRWLPTSGCEVFGCGKDRRVRLDDAERAIEANGLPDDAECPSNDDVQFESVDDVLAAVGMKRAR
jgi:hypothetical protein